ncbi:MAG: SigE family RNA polymerase sigma factor [Acidimicrobiia bacterium]|nr:SigE family RNA polymerase sigma factor [Acidimicrobiia bacterium]
MTESVVPPDDELVRIPLHFDSFYRSEYRSIFGLVYGLTGSKAVAEDLTQETFLRAHKSWDDVGRYDNPHGWVRRVASNLAMSRFRRLRSESKALVRLGVRNDWTMPTLSVEYEAFWDRVRALPKRQAQVVALHYLEDLSIAEIANVLEIAEGTVKAQLHRARSSLAKSLHAEKEDLR